MVNNPAIIGPAGGSGGDGWDDGSMYTGIRQINISYGQAISKFEVVYDLNGLQWSGTAHGAGVKLDKKIDLQFPKEYVKSVSGYFGPLSEYKHDVICSIKFTTNLGAYGPYGNESGTPFEFTIPSVPNGFIGRSSEDYLHAIGVRVQGPLQI